MEIEWNGIAMEISQEMLIEIMSNHILKEREETVLEEVLDESQTTLKAYLPPVDRSRPNGHAKGWSSHCSRCGTRGRKCLERLNNRCHTCKDFENSDFSQWVVA
tara:strand:- start:884 stop:1195 length:312 start_codon:yes stop_codon:yes gene_type:complete